MAPSMKAGLEITCSMGRAVSLMPMEMSTKVTGRMAKLTESESILTMTVKSIMESGNKISSMGMDLRNGLTAPATKGNIVKERSTA
jgi:hypothetical protein